MSVIDRTRLHQFIDEATEEELVDFQQLLLQVKKKHSQQDSHWVKELYDLFEPVREEVRKSGMTEEEVNAILDEELETVRQEMYEKGLQITSHRRSE